MGANISGFLIIIGSFNHKADRSMVVEDTIWTLAKSNTYVRTNL